MSEEDKKLTEEMQENVEESAEEPKKSIGKMGKIFLVAGIVLAQAATAYFVVNQYYPDIKKFSWQFESASGVYYKFEDVIINPAESNGERYLILSLTVKLNDESALGTIDKKNAEVKDRINASLSNYTARQLHSLSKRDDIKKELGIIINEVIGKKSVRNLFFTKYVLQ